jgi:hypothetical protein
MKAQALRLARVENVRPQIPRGECERMGQGRAYRFMAASAASRVFFVCSQYVLSSSPVDWRERGGRAQEDISSSGQWVRRERGRWIKTRSLGIISFEVNGGQERNIHLELLLREEEDLIQFFVLVNDALLFSR